MGLQTSLRSKAAQFFNPVSDKPSKLPPSSSPDEAAYVKGGSFTTFFSSLLVSSEAGKSSHFEEKEEGKAEEEAIAEGVMKGSRGRRSLISKGKQSVGWIIAHAAHYTGCRSHGSERKFNEEMQYEDGCKSRLDGVEMEVTTKMEADHASICNLPACSEISMLLSERTRSCLYTSLPALVQGRKWVLLYSTWKHGISLSTLYRRSMLWPGLSLLVVGDRKGATFGGLVEAPLRASSMRRYQGSSLSFVFTNTSGRPVVYRPTGVNQYFTVCSLDYLALGGGGHFALYLDQDLLTGSSAFSETYGNPCLAHTQDFDVKEVELWGFVYASQFDEVMTMSQSEAPGICRW